MAVYEVAGKRVLVTGASSGIGWELTKAFAAAGARLVILARREERLNRLADELADLSQGRPVVIPADLAEQGRAAAAADAVTGLLGGVDVLVNNAGSAVGGTTWAVADRPEARHAFEVDFWAPLALIGALVPGMRHRREGVVVNVTSLRQVLAWPTLGHSSAANAALAQATETLRLELLPYGVHVIEVVPGPIDTPAQGPTQLIQGFAEAVHDRLGVASAHELAALIVHAVRHGHDRVFCPQDTTREAYENPTALRTRMRAQTRRLLGDGIGLPDDLLDTLVIGADHPLITQARDSWEHQREHEQNRRSGGPANTT